MSKTQADRAMEYRQRKRDANVTPKRDAVTEDRDENVTAAERDAPTVTGEPGPFDDASARAAERMAKPTFADLPLDVRQEIERMCFETTGQREGSHSRAAMTEQALACQVQFGKPYSKGATTAKVVV